MNKLLGLIVLLIMNVSIAYGLSYDYSSTTKIPIFLNIVEEISTKDSIVDGHVVNLRVAKDVYLGNSTVLKQGQIVQAKVACIITSGMNGFPYEIIIDDYTIPNIKSTQIIGTYTKAGQNRCFWVYPLKWALTFLPPTGSLTNFIKGGHATIKTTDTIKIYYYPEWK